MICRCGAETIQAKDGLCKRCRLREYQVIKYPWTPEMDAQLTRIYRGSRNKTELTRGLTAFGTRYRMPRYILINRAQTLDLRQRRQTTWTKAEAERIRELAGDKTIADIALQIGRTEGAVKQRISILGLSGKITEGYSHRELAALFGVHHNTIMRWVGRGWLDIACGRITHESVERFVWNHIHEYRFAACDETWLKMTLKPPTANKVYRTPERKAA